MRKHYPLNSNGDEDAGQMPWTDGVPSTGVQGSFPGHAIVTDTEAEILAAVDAAGLTRSGSDLTQLVQAISRGVFLGTFTGSANALTGALPNSVVLPGLLLGMRFSGVVSTANTAGVVVSLTGFTPAVGALPLLRRDGAALQAGDLPLNVPFDFRYDGAAFRLSTPAPSEIQAQAVTIINSLKIAGGVPQQWAAAGTYTLALAAGITFAVTECRGGGGAGGGASSTSAAASGGGGGGSALKVATTTAATVLQINVGVGGTPGVGGTTPGNGTAGGTSSVVVQSGQVVDFAGNVYGPGATLCAATGGGQGFGSNSGPQATSAGTAGVGSGGDLNLRGDPGGFPYLAGPFVGGVGGGSPGSGGQPQVNYGNPGNSTTAAGVGGNGSASNGAGGAGAPGRVTIQHP